jgi:hypothetical protein
MTAKNPPVGRELAGFVESVRLEYWRRERYEEHPGGVRQPNSVRVVAGQILEDLGPVRRSAVVAELLELESVELVSDLDAVFRASDSVGTMVFDLVCEVCWQLLVADLEVRIEDEVRAALALA